MKSGDSPPEQKLGNHVVVISGRIISYLITMDWTGLSGLLSLLCLLCTVYAQDIPKITQVILPEIKRAGETGMLNCTVTRQGNNKVYWYNKKTEMFISSDISIDVEDSFNPIIDGFPKYDIIRTPRFDQNTYTLVIRRMQLTDAGKYVCQVHVKGLSEMPSKEGEMVVLLQPTIVQSGSSRTQTVQEGKNVNFTCAAEGFPTPWIRWMRPNGKALPLPGLPYTLRSNTLSLVNLTREDRGVYRCIADNDVRPPATHDITLFVEFRPFSKAVQTSYGQAQNRMFDLTIECRIAGNPEPDMNWFKKVGDGATPIKNDDKHMIHILLSHSQELGISETWYMLTIINVQANDYGIYYCEGSNKLGKHNATVEVYETSECQGPSCIPENIPTGSGVMVTAHCIATVAMVLLACFMH